MDINNKFSVIIDCLREIMDKGAREEFIEDYDNGHRYETTRGINIDSDVLKRLMTLEEEIDNGPTP